MGITCTGCGKKESVPSDVESSRNRSSQRLRGLWLANATQAGEVITPLQQQVFQGSDFLFIK